MFHAITLALAIAGTQSQSSTNRDNSQPATSQSPSLSETHIPSAGVTLETLRMLPPPYNRWSNAGPSPVIVYQPTYNVVPSYPIGYPYTYGFRMYGLGGYYPQGVGGRYPSS